MKTAKKISLLSLALSATMILGCSSSSTTSHYYLLNKPPMTQQAVQAAVSKNSQSPKSVFAVQVQLAEYLNQPYIVMQLGTHQINYSSFHLWAEPLLLGIKKSLLFDLNAHGQASTFINEKLTKANKHLVNKKIIKTIR